jgi:hypothetical protein
MLQLAADNVKADKLASVAKVKKLDVYFSADVETDGPIPGPYSMLSFAIVFAGTFDGEKFSRPSSYEKIFYRELKPISKDFEEEALAVNGLDRASLVKNGNAPELVMTEASEWIASIAGGGSPVLVAFPVSFDWSWLYWYFVKFGRLGSPFSYSRCFDIKTAYSVKSRTPISNSGRSRVDSFLRSDRKHTHHAIDDAISQAEVFANVFEWMPNDQ